MFSAAKNILKVIMESQNTQLVEGVCVPTILTAFAFYFTRSKYISFKTFPFIQNTMLNSLLNCRCVVLPKQHCAGSFWNYTGNEEHSKLSFLLLRLAPREFFQ